MTYKPENKLPCNITGHFKNTTCQGANFPYSMQFLCHQPGSTGTFRQLFLVPAVTSLPSGERDVLGGDSAEPRGHHLGAPVPLGAKGTKKAQGTSLGWGNLSMRTMTPGGRSTK